MREPFRSRVRNEAEAERERNERQAIIAGLAKQLARGDKALIGNSAHRRYLRRTPSASGKPGPAFEIDSGKLAEEARYDEGPSISIALVDKVHSAAIRLTTSSWINTGAISALCSAT